MVMLERLFYKVLSYGNVTKERERLFYKVLSYGNVGKVILQSTVLW